MGYWDYDDDRDSRIRRSDANLRQQGFVRDEYGTYSDPNNVTRTEAYIDPVTGQVNRGM